MSIDWYVLLTPIVLVVVALPLLFVGCTRFTSDPGAPPKAVRIRPCEHRRGRHPRWCRSA